MPDKKTRPALDASKIRPNPVTATLQTWPKPLRIMVGLFFSATAAVYFSAILSTLSGNGRHTVFMWNAVGMNIGLLMLVNLLAYPKRAFWLANGIYGLIAIGITIAEMVTLESPGGYAAWWKGYLFVFSGPLINAWLYRRYQSSVVE